MNILGGFNVHKDVRRFCINR